MLAASVFTMLRFPQAVRILLLLAAPLAGADAPGPAAVLALPTFHCVGLYWTPEEGAASRDALVAYRPAGATAWRTGLPLRYHPVDTPECRATYRGSLVHLTPGTTYEIALSLSGTSRRATCHATTWTESFPVGERVIVTNRDATLLVKESGRPDAYRVYDGTGCTIDVGHRQDHGIEVRASHVILRGFTIRHAQAHGIRLFSGHDIVIEDCDISGWGSESEQGWGRDYQAAVFSNSRDLRRVVVQRCRLHHPTWDANSWAEEHAGTHHPMGPQTVVFWESAGNHVIRYNECYSDADHYFNDVMGAGKNGSHRGFPGPDSDVYGNYIANAWDDGLEIEGGGQNVRVWHNYIEEVLIPIANAAVSIGPLYVWRNVSGRSHSPPGSSWDMSHGPFVKMGYADGEHWMTGHQYFFNNTVFQPEGEGAGGLGGHSRIIRYCTTRNNVLHVRPGERRSIATNDRHAGNDFDHDLLSGSGPEHAEPHGLRGVPQYVAGAGFDPATRSGLFQLASDSPGHAAAVVIPNFCEPAGGDAPDLGAHQAGTERLRFGVGAASAGTR